MRAIKLLCCITAFVVGTGMAFVRCNSETQANPAKDIAPTNAQNAPAATAHEGLPPAADAKTILAKQQVPILCYHQIRDWKPADSKTARDYIVPEAIFRDHIKSLADSGYHSILPDQLYDYLVYGKPLPSKPVMITFDDTRLDQYTVALPELEKFGFKGVFFIMTVSLGKPGYMSRDQVKDLSARGHLVGSHTYDHQNVKKYTGKDWEEQIVRPSKTLADITGKKTDYFAYPFGLWNREAIPHLKELGFKAVFQLSTARDDNDPLYTIRRIIVTGYRNGAGIQRQMKESF